MAQTTRTPAAFDLAPAEERAMAGILRSSRYAFGPNRLHYCGPDANRELLGYIREGASDPGLQKIMQGFATLYPYLQLIARANQIRDPFDERVVAAYWVGNELLERVERHALWRNLIEDHQLKKRLSSAVFSEIEEKIAQYAVPHHSFHVLNVWRRTGHHAVPHTLESMDSCRIGWGKIIATDGPWLELETEPLVLENGKHALGAPIRKRLMRRLESPDDIEQVKIEDIVSFHWGVPCEVITPREAAMLRRYTEKSIAFANQTI